MAKISIIVPIYNSSKYLKKCINSITNQTLEDIEIILVDDNSTDSSLDIIKNYEKEDSRIKVIHLDENKGIGSARNIGIEEANGKYIGFVDSDDYIHPKMYERLFFGAERNNVEIARCDKVSLLYGIDYKKLYNKENNRKDSQIIKPKKTPYYLINESCACWNKIYRHDFIEKFNFPTNLKYEDYPFTVEILGSADRIYSTNKKMYYYRRRIGSNSNDERKNLDIKTLDIFKCNEKIKDFYINEDLFSTFSEALNDLFIIHTIHHCYPILTTTVPFDKKKEIINNYIRYMEIEYGNFLNNEIYISKRDKSLVFGKSMKFIEKHIIDPKYQQYEIKEEIMDNMKRLILENSRNNK